MVKNNFYYIMENLIKNFKKDVFNLITETNTQIKTIKNLKEKSDILNDLSIKWEKLTTQIEKIRLKIGSL